MKMQVNIQTLNFLFFEDCPALGDQRGAHHESSSRYNARFWSKRESRAETKDWIISWLKIKRTFCFSEVISPSALTGKQHTFKMKTFLEPTYCSHCKKLLLGSFYQGYYCEREYSLLLNMASFRFQIMFCDEIALDLWHCGIYITSICLIINNTEIILLSTRQLDLACYAVIHIISVWNK